MMKNFYKYIFIFVTGLLLIFKCNSTIVNAAEKVYYGEKWAVMNTNAMCKDLIVFEGAYCGSQDYPNESTQCNTENIMGMMDNSGQKCCPEEIFNNKLNTNTQAEKNTVEDMRINGTHIGSNKTYSALLSNCIVIGPSGVPGVMPTSVPTPTPNPLTPTVAPGNRGNTSGTQCVSMAMKIIGDRSCGEAVACTRGRFDSWYCCDSAETIIKERLNCSNGDEIDDYNKTAGACILANKEKFVNIGESICVDNTVNKCESGSLIEAENGICKGDDDMYCQENVVSNFISAKCVSVQPASEGKCGDPSSDNPDYQKCCTSNTLDETANISGLSSQSVATALNDTMKKIKDSMVGEELINQISASMKCVSGAIPTGEGDNCVCTYDATDDKQICLSLYGNNVAVDGTNTPVGGTINPEYDKCLETVKAKGKMCVQYASGKTEFIDCIGCFEKDGFWSGLGCVKFGSWSDFVGKTIFPIAISLAGMIAFLCIIASAISIQISSGNAEKIKKAQEMMTSCIMGLILIIFAVFILRLIGVSILKIPGLN